jgi:DNA end-binding protein Ku
MVLETMYWPDEIRSVSELELPTGKQASPESREVGMARTLIESLASHFDPKQYKDEFRGKLLDLIERKMKTDRRSAKRRKPEPNVIDLMEALQASFAARTEQKSSDSSARRTAKTRTSTARKPAGQKRKAPAAAKRKAA